MKCKYDTINKLVRRLEAEQAQSGTARPFRIGKALYEQKFALEIQSASSAEQTFRKALATRPQLPTL